MMIKFHPIYFELVARKTAHEKSKECREKVACLKRGAGEKSNIAKRGCGNSIYSLVSPTRAQKISSGAVCRVCLPTRHILALLLRLPFQHWHFPARRKGEGKADREGAGNKNRL